MAVIANLYFPNNGSGNVNVQKEKWVTLFENMLDTEREELTRSLFVRKVVPILAFCGASINTTFIEQNRLYSYEILVDNEDLFLKELHRLENNGRLLT